MKVLSKYRLELHWESVAYPEEDVAVLTGAYFCGPVLDDSAKINEDDQLMLDMTGQHYVMIPDYYQAVLKWKGVEYRGSKVFLKGVSIQGKHVNSVETLNDSEFILIDCYNHEEKRHPFHLVYFAEICKENKEGKF